MRALCGHIKPLVPLFLFLCLFRAGTGHAEEEAAPLEVYKTILDHKSLLTSPQFLVIDDFNEGKFSNRQGSLWQTKVPAIGALDLAIKKGDARNPERGSALYAAFNLRPGEKASFHSRLNDLDVSQAEYLVFKCRFRGLNTDAFDGALSVTLTDSQREKVSQNVTASCPVSDTEWGEVILPLQKFEELDLNRLFTFQIILSKFEKPVQGDLIIDELAFFGFNDVAFESNRDNLLGFPKVTYDEARRMEINDISKPAFMLKAIAEDTWKYFLNAVDRETGLVVDHIRTGDAPLAAAYTSPTNIAMDLLATVSAMDLGFIEEEQAIEKIGKVLETLELLRRYEGFFFNFYDTRRLTVTRSYISSVDSGWLAIALVVVRQAFAEAFGERVSKILDSFSFESFLDPENNQLVIGFDVPKREFGHYHYGMLVTEARATSLYAIGKGDVARRHWWFLYRTLPEIWDWQNQTPQGEMKTRDGIQYFQGYYEHKGEKFVPSWGGSLFEVLMPTLVIDEKRFAKNGLGKNNEIMTRLQREYAEEKDYPVWGISPAATSSGRRWEYHEYGVHALGAKGYPDRLVITPHVSFLALDADPKEAIRNIRRLMRYPKVYGEYGLFDSLNLRSGRVNPQYLALDQGMSLVAICNYITGGAIQKRFHADPVGQAIEDLLDEDFFS